MDYYVSVFPNSRIVSIAEYPDESLSEHVADEHFAGKQGKVLTGESVSYTHLTLPTILLV